MKNLLATIALLSACGGEHRPSLSIPADRPPTLAEMRSRGLVVTLRYDPATVPAPFWTTWRGTAALDLEGPEAGLDHLPAVLSLDQGFEDLDDCLPSSLDGAWSLGAGTLGVTTIASDPSEATLALTGTATMHYRHVGPEIVGEIVGRGAWTAMLGTGCEGDDFAGGTAGTWTLEEAPAQAATVDDEPHPRGPRARLLALREDGQVTVVEGPVGSVLRVAGGLR